MDQNILRIGGMKATEIVKEYGTPVYVYDGGVAETKYEKLQKALPNFDIFYSLKANPNMSLCSLFKSFGTRAEVASGGELYKALQAGFQPENIIFVGPAKTREELEYALKTNIYAIIAESPHELKLLDQVCKDLDTHAQVMLRINRKSFSGTAPELMIGGPSKFGFDEENVVPAVNSLSLDHIDIIGVHIYAASGLLDVEPVIENTKATIELGKRYSDALGFDLKALDIGGGIGVPYSKDQKEFNIRKLGQKMETLLSDYGLEDTRLILESGRYLVAECGVFLTKILNVKESRGKKFVLTDGGMNHEIRPVFMDLNHPTRVITKLNKTTKTKADIVGPLCTPIDVLAEDVPIPQVERGDLIGIFNAGAYGYSMSMLNFLSHPWPSEVIVHKGDSYLVRERGDFQDITAKEMPKTF